MAIYPRAKYRPVTGLANDPPIRPIGVILHVSASNATSLHGWFNGPSGGIESHLHIPTTPDHPIEQYRDTAREADANYKGNSWTDGGERLGFLSVETQGLGDGAWSPYQLDEILLFLRWAAAEHGFPLRRCPSYRSAGIGYHVMFGSGEGTNSWSNARGKVCPGSRRIAQFKDIILPTLARAAGAATPPLEDFMATMSEDEKGRLLGAVAKIEAMETQDRDAAARAEGMLGNDVLPRLAVIEKQLGVLSDQVSKLASS